MRRNWLPSDEVARVLGVSARAVRARAKRNDWASRRVPRNGGGPPAIEYAFESLPEAAKQELARREVEQIKADHAAAELARKQAELSDQIRREKSLAKLATLNQTERAEVDAKIWILKATQTFVEESGMPKTKATRAFCDLYTAGEIEAPEDVWTSVQNASPASLRRWQKQLDKDGPAALAPSYGRRSARVYEAAITEENEIGQFVLGMLLQKGQTITWKTLHAIAVTEAKRGKLPSPIPSARTFQRYLQWLKANRPTTWENLVHPHAARGRVMPAFGDRSENVTRVNQLWELDSTLADVLLEETSADGSSRFVRYNLLACVDIYTRRVRFLVSKRSRAVAIANLLRRCILEWGVPTGVKMDNGKDYRSKHLALILDQLKVDVSFCMPYAPYQKPFVERVIGTFQHGWFTLIPGYTGASVAERDALRSRRMPTAAGEPPLQLGEVKFDPTRFQEFADDWTTRFYAHEKHEALGTTPFKQANVPGQRIKRIENERALDILLAKPAGSRNGLFKVSRKGIRYQPEHLRGTWWFTAPELVGEGWIGREVLCREDMTDVGQLFVADPDTGDHICIATEPKLLGNSKAEIAQAANRLYKQNQREILRAARAAARKHQAGEVLDEMMAQRLEETGKIAGRIGPSESYETPALRGAMDAAEALQQRGQRTIVEPSEEELAAADALAAKLQRQRDAEAEALEQDLREGEAVLLRMSKSTRRYRDDSEHYDDLMDRISAGHQPNTEETAFIERFESAVGGFGAQSNAG